MKIFLIRHGKANNSLKDKLPYEEFEMTRPLLETEVERAKALGSSLKETVGAITSCDIVHSGKVRSTQTVTAVAEGLGLSPQTINEKIREDRGLIYLADKTYWEDCETAVSTGLVPSHADFFLTNDPSEYFKKHAISDYAETFNAEHMLQNMRLVLKRAIEQNQQTGNQLSIMVSHEPVISLFMSDLFGKTVSELGGSCNELEYALFEVMPNDSQESKVTLSYRKFAKEILIK